MWPNVNTNWQASAKIASQATPPPFDLNHLMSREGPETDIVSLLHRSAL
jgi:hypothetical protein